MTEIEIRPDAEKYVAQLQRMTNAVDGEDDLDLWRAVVSTLMRETEYEIRRYDGTRPVILRFGRNNHWLRPHQTRWTADGGFAWPSGYGGKPWSREGLPQPEWMTYLKWHRGREEWRLIPYDAVPGKKYFLRAVAVPARTTRHKQAAIHSIWPLPLPHLSPQETAMFYGLRRGERGWELKATRAVSGSGWGGMIYPLP